jgi:hypothetical protein
MVCPSCGARIDGQGKFCANCGAHLPEGAVPAPPPDYGAQFGAPPPPPPPPYGAPQYGGPPPPQYGAPQFGAPQQPYPPQPYPPQQFGGPQYGAPPQPYGAPPYGGAQWGVPTAATGAGGAPIAGLLAALGGVVAVASAWLPFANGLGASSALIDATDTKSLACGYYLIIGGVVAAFCGLLLLRRSVGPSSSHLLFGLGAIAGGILVVGVEVAAWRQVQDLLDTMNSFGGADSISFGIGLYLGAAAGALSAVGGLIGLAGRR